LSATRRLWCVFASLAVSSGLAVGQSLEPEITQPPQPSWLEALWNLPVMKWLSGFQASPVAPPEIAIAAPIQPPCRVAPLQAIEDAEALTMENAGAGSNLNLDGLTPHTTRALTRFQTSIERQGGSFTLTSAYRPSAYQSHLRDVWFKWMFELRDNHDPSCMELKAEVGNEFARHSLLTTQYPVAVSDHTLGIAFDAAISFPAAAKRAKRRRVALDRLARLSGVQRPDVRRDPVHFRLIGGRG
jgi:hypothetical protein